MNKNIIALIFSCIALSSQAQDAKPDKIVKLNSEELAVTVVNVDENNVSFTYLGEKAVNMLSKKQIKEIDFGSGRVEKFSEKTVINGEQDWEKVQISTLESDVTGLKRLGEVRAKASGGSNFSNQANIDARATEKIKRAAAKMGAHIILVQAQTTQRGVIGGFGHMGQVPTSLKQGVAYGY